MLFFVNIFYICQRGAWLIARVQLEAALVIDGVDVLVEGLRAKLDADELDSWRSTFRRGQVYNDGSPGIQCRRQPSVRWQHGPDLIRFIKQVHLTPAFVCPTFATYMLVKFREFSLKLNSFQKIFHKFKKQYSGKMISNVIIIIIVHYAKRQHIKYRKQNIHRFNEHKVAHILNQM